MKKIVTIVLFSITCIASYAQTKDWKQIGAPHKSPLEIIYQSKGGVLFGLDEGGDILSISSDQGQTWCIFCFLFGPYDGLH
jgi:hypothetical protein